MEPRGIRNNNPGNIRKSQTAWQGLAANQNDPDFCTFVSMAYGVRAMAVILLNYYRLHDLKTVAAIISRWAPPNENNTVAYIAAVASHMGVKPGDELDLTDDAPELEQLVDAIVRHENGQDISPRDTLEGCMMALAA